MSTSKLFSMQSQIHDELGGINWYNEQGQEYKANPAVKKFFENGIVLPNKLVTYVKDAIEPLPNYFIAEKMMMKENESKQRPSTEPSAPKPNRYLSILYKRLW